MLIVAPIVSESQLHYHYTFQHRVGGSGAPQGGPSVNNKSGAKPVFQDLYICYREKHKQAS